MRQAVVALGVVVIAVGVLWLVIGGEALDRDDGEVVTIESISEPVIRDFDAEGNDIGFVLDESAQSFPMGYHTGVPSEDGKSLRFEIPEYLGACHNHHPEGADDCPSMNCTTLTWACCRARFPTRSRVTRFDSSSSGWR